jgi:hypothetical protein
MDLNLRLACRREQPGVERGIGELCHYNRENAGIFLLWETRLTPILFVIEAYQRSRCTFRNAMKNEGLT